MSTSDTSTMEHLSASRERIDQIIARNQAPHMRPIWLAVRDCGCGFMIVPQGRDLAFELIDRPTVVLLGDDTYEALGPNGFHRPSLVKAIERTASGTVYSGALIPMPYLTAAATVTALAAIGSDQAFLLIETRVEREREWIDFIRSIRADLHLLVVTPRSEGGVH